MNSFLNSMKQYFTQNTVAIISLIILGGLAAYLFKFADEDQVKIWNILFKVVLYWSSIGLYNKFFNGNDFKQDNTIASESRSLSSFLGDVAIGTAIIIAIG